MPIVPKSNTPEIGRQTVTAGVPGIGGTIVGRGMAAIGEGIQSALDTTMKVGDKFAELYDEAEADKRVLEFLKRRTTLLSHPGDEKAGIAPGLLNRSGAAAQGATAEYQTLIDKEFEEIGKGLSPRALRVYRATVLPDLMNGFQTVARHESQHVKEGRAKVATDLANEYGRNVSSNYLSDPQEAIADLARMEAQIRVAREGMAGENVPTNPKEKELFDAATQVYINDAKQKAIIGRGAAALANNDVRAAKAVLDQFGGMLDDSERIALKSSIDGAFVETATRNSVRAVVHSLGPNADTRAVKDTVVQTMADALSRVGITPTTAQIDNAEKLAEAELDDLRADEDRSKVEAPKASLSKLQTAIQSNSIGNEAVGYTPPGDVMRTYAEERSRLVQMGADDAIAKLDTMINNWRDNPAAGGYAAVSDPLVVAETNALTDEELRRMSNQDVSLLKPYLTKSKHDEIAQRHKTAQGKKPTDTPVLETSQIQQVVLAGLNEAGVISTRKLTSLSSEQLDTLNRVVELVQIQAGENLTLENVETGLARAVLKEHDSQGFFGGIKEDVYSPADLLANPRQARQTPLWKRMIDAGYSEEMLLDNPVILKRALQEQLRNDVRRGRTSQNNAGAYR